MDNFNTESIHPSYHYYREVEQPRSSPAGLTSVSFLKGYTVSPVEIVEIGENEGDETCERDASCQFIRVCPFLSATQIL